MAEINLLPRKEFEIILGDGKVIAGKFGTWAVKRYCDKKGVALEDEISKEEDASQPLSERLDDVVLLLLCAVEYSCRLNKKEFSYNDADVFDWIDQLGGLVSNRYLSLIGHASQEGEKKSEVDQSALTTS